MTTTTVKCPQCDHQFDVGVTLQLGGVSLTEYGRWVSVSAFVQDHDALADQITAHYAASHVAPSTYMDFRNP